MSGIVIDYQKPLKPSKWPQDTLKTPAGGGMMPAVDYINSTVVKREYFTYITNFVDFTGAVQHLQNIIATDKDGDFWISSICASGVTTGGGVSFVSALNAHVRITDQRTQYTIYNPLVHFNSLNRVERGVFAQGEAYLSNLIEPYCILRGTGIIVELDTTLFSPFIHSAYFALSGWKEYQNAAS